jgi:hypothetical protein
VRGTAERVFGGYWVAGRSRGVMEAVGMRYVRAYHQRWDDPLPGAEAGEVEYEVTRKMWLAR